MAPTDSTVEPKAKPGTGRDEPIESTERLESTQDEDVVDVFWLTGESCDGCSVSTLGAVNPGVEDLIQGTVPQLPRINLHHPVLSLEWGDEFTEKWYEAENGERDPYVVVVEGSVPNERLIDGDGYWISLGKEDGEQVKMVDWLDRLAPDAAAVIAIGTCATWGGIPSAEGNATDAMGTMDYLGQDYRSVLGLPVINVPGCAPIGENFVETVTHLLFYVEDVGPLPEFDELGRPQWLFGGTVHRNCNRGSYYDEGDFAEECGSEKCLVELGCWGPVVKCNMPSRRAVDGVGGCMNVGGKCIGCTMPGFPHKFLLENWAGYQHVGERPKHMINTGVWDDPEVYNARYEDADEWGRARLATPGVIEDGELVTTNLTEIDMGVEEFVDHSFYEDWTEAGRRFETNPAGGPISPYHPWNKDTRPAPEGTSWREKYSWATAPRWDRTAMETGPHSRQWITALAGEVDNTFIEPTGDGLEITVPEAELPEMTVRWDIPDRLNAAERLRAKAHHISYLAAVCYTNFMDALEAMKGGDTQVHNSFSVPDRGTHRGVGIWEAGRGYLTHHVTIEDGVIDNYQIITPSTWMASPTDAFDQPGPYEEAATNTPFLEEYSGREEFTGADILRAVRSFDPCMPCTVHTHSDEQTDIITKDVSSCGCSFGGGDKAADETIRDIVAEG